MFRDVVDISKMMSHRLCFIRIVDTVNYDENSNKNQDRFLYICVLLHDLRSEFKTKNEVSIFSDKDKCFFSIDFNCFIFICLLLYLFHVLLNHFIFICKIFLIT